MSHRINRFALADVVSRLNRITDNNPAPYSDGAENAGTYWIQGAYSGNALMQNYEGGGARNVFGGYRPTRELYEMMQAYIAGIIDASRTLA